MRVSAVLAAVLYVAIIVALCVVALGSSFHPTLATILASALAVDSVALPCLALRAID